MMELILVEVEQLGTLEIWQDLLVMLDLNSLDQQIRDANRLEFGQLMFLYVAVGLNLFLNIKFCFDFSVSSLSL